jgi:hypothetical protein
MRNYSDLGGSDVRRKKYMLPTSSRQQVPPDVQISVGQKYFE